ncbi:MAG: tRNA (adenosine(37)-N6)-threonylcarbamoyltransferase complex ATPase subunit type 1 TsaE [Alphaproteobacteria bacterium]|nr:tRNA (adenosine(37)-N6)-threonylcarbamoyltransferase complex ATPase subunit type 1 TsaE [Alphaproteobacteria bacterium]
MRRQVAAPSRAPPALEATGRGRYNRPWRRATGAAEVTSGDHLRRLADLAATEALASLLAAAAAPGDVLALGGDLGAGKTSFARAFVTARSRLADVPPEEVPSPTYTLVQVYELPNGTIWHMDLYRIDRPDDAWELGIEDALGQAILLIEWPERLGASLPRDRLDVRLALPPDAAGDGARGGARLAALEPQGMLAPRLAAVARGWMAGAHG